MKKMLVDKETILKQVELNTKEQLKKVGATNFKFIKSEWTDKGIIIYYND